MMNVTGWNELYDGNIIASAYTLYNGLFGGWIIVILFLLFQLMLYFKTQSPLLTWSTGAIFLSIFAFTGFVKPEALGVLFVIIVIETTAIIWPWIFK